MELGREKGEEVLLFLIMKKVRRSRLKIWLVELFRFFLPSPPTLILVDVVAWLQREKNKIHYDLRK